MLLKKTMITFVAGFLTMGMAVPVSHGNAGHIIRQASDLGQEAAKILEVDGKRLDTQHKDVQTEIENVQKETQCATDELFGLPGTFGCPGIIQSRH
ncbi:hypothetical protein N431DRAFT_434445 [Stipitochalara longipes BDJ]|nr:hypothetical protein N431DRAFT_434445 [Stipitochalara longipes BDJ]